MSASNDYRPAGPTWSAPRAACCPKNCYCCSRCILIPKRRKEVIEGLRRQDRWSPAGRAAIRGQALDPKRIEIRRWRSWRGPRRRCFPSTPPHGSLRAEATPHKSKTRLPSSMARLNPTQRKFRPNLANRIPKSERQLAGDTACSHAALLPWVADVGAMISCGSSGK